jgi:hypothetical protein
MMETIATPDDREIELLEEYLPILNAQERAYLKGATKALLYAQEDANVPRPCLRSCKSSDNRRSVL